MKEDLLFEWGAKLGTPVARSTDRPTSHAAAASIPRKRQIKDAWVVICRWFRAALEGLTDDQWAEERGESDLPSGKRTRRHEVEVIGWLADSGRKILTRRGCEATVWVITEEGKAYYERGIDIFMDAYRVLKKQAEEDGRLPKPKGAKKPKGVEVELVFPD